ncbi:MAG: amidohydrolase family protein [Pirellulaceae bacterium]
MNSNLPNDSAQVASQKIFAARWIVPVVSEPIQGGWIRIHGNRIVEIQQGKPPKPAIDLGDVAILPGLVNSHTHLEFSDCPQPIGAPGVPLATWIGQVIGARSATTAQSKQAAIANGLQQSVAVGVRLIGEITTPPCDYPESEIDIVGFAEVVGLSESRWRDRLQAATDHNERFTSAGWSPHAPYSTSRQAIEACVKRSAAIGRPLAMHVAESPAERELLCGGTGPFADSLRSIGVWQDGVFPWGDDPIVGLIKTLSDAPQVLLVHCNDLRKSEIDAVAMHSNLTVVYCPRTHAFFGYDRHPVAEMLRAGIPIAIGTDSRASNPDLNLWSEVQYLLNNRMDISPHDVLKMATFHGANGLGRPDKGRLAVDAKPGLGIVETNADTIDALFRDMAGNAYRPK